MKKALIIAGCTLAFAACKAKDKDVANNVRVATEANELQGSTFQAACVDNKALTLPSSRVQYKFSGSNVYRIETWYDQPKCAEDGFQFVESGTFDVHKNDRSNDGGYAIDFHFSHLEGTALSDGGAKAGWCTAFTWSKDNKNDLTGHATELKCYNGSAEPRDFYNRYRVDGDKLTLSVDDKSKNGKDDRPKTLGNVVFTK